MFRSPTNDMNILWGVPEDWLHEKEGKQRKSKFRYRIVRKSTGKAISKLSGWIFLIVFICFDVARSYFCSGAAFKWVDVPQLLNLLEKFTWQNLNFFKFQEFWQFAYLSVISVFGYPVLEIGNCPVVGFSVPNFFSHHSYHREIHKRKGKFKFYNIDYYPDQCELLWFQAVRH